MHTRKKTMLYFFLPAAIFMLIFLLYPLLTLFFNSFFTVLENGNKDFAGLSNYIKAFQSNAFLTAFKNTFVYVFLAVSLETILGLLLAIVLTHKYKGFTSLRTLMLSPLMIAPIVAGLIWKFMLSNQFGIINTLLVKFGIIESTSSILWLADPKITLISVVIADIWLTTPFMMLMFLAGIQGISNGLFEAAVMEGATKLQIIFKIVIPNIKPVLFSALIVRIIDAARSFDIVWAMTQGGPNNSSELLSIHIYKTLQRYNDIGFSSAMAMIFIIVLISVTLIFRKKINE